MYLQRIVFGVSFNLNLQSQSHWSLFNESWQQRRRELDDLLSFEIGEMTLQMQYRVAKTHRMPCLYRSFSAKEPYD